MKNAYLFLTGLVITSGIHYLSQSDDRSSIDSNPISKVTEHSPKQGNRQKTSSPQKRSTRSTAFLAPSLTATNTYALTQDNGVPGASAGDELEFTITLFNSGTDATGVSFTDQLDANTTLVPGSVTTSPIAKKDSYTTIGNVGLDIPAASGILSNDISPDGSTLTITGSPSVTTTKGGTATINLTTGAFTYTPPVAFEGIDTLHYTIQNASGVTDAGIVSITSTGLIWFIDDDASAGGANGTLAKPFNSISAFQAVNNGGTNHPKIGDFIFLFSGNYGDGLTLLNSQKLIGQASTVSLTSLTGYPAPSGNTLLPSMNNQPPALTNSAGSVITLGQNNTLRGISIGTTSASKLIGNNFGTLTTRDISLSGNGTALSLTDGTLDALFTSLSSTTTSTPAIAISNTNGSLQTSSGSLTSSANSALTIEGKSTADRLTLNMTLTSVSSGSTSKGLVLSNTSGSFSVTGVGSFAGSGGTLQNITTRGAEFMNANGVSLKNINFTNANTSEGTVPVSGDNTASNAAIYASNVAGLTLENVIISGTTVQQGINLNSVSNLTIESSSVASAGTTATIEEGCIYAINTSGTNVIRNSTFSNPGGRVAYFGNTNTNMTSLTIDNTIFQNAVNGSGLLFEGNGSSSMKLYVKSTSQFLNCQTHGIEVYGNGSASVQADLQNSTINNQNNTGTGFDIAGSGSSLIKFKIAGNTTNAKNGTAITMFAYESAKLEGVVDNNTINKNGGSGSGIVFDAEGTSAYGIIKISNNVINDIISGSGITTSAKSTGNARSDISIVGNTIKLYAPSSTSNIVINAVSGYPSNNATICANINNNNASVNNGVLLTATGGVATAIKLQGSGPTLLDNWNANTNLPTGTSGNIIQSGSTFTFGQTCLAPDVSNLRMMASEDILAVSDSSSTAPLAVPPINASAEPIENTTRASKALNPATKELTASIPTPNAKTEAALSGETVTINGTGSGFTLPAGEEVVIKFKVTINEDIPADVCTVSNQGTVSADGMSDVLTDDPAVTGAENPTDTPVLSAPAITFCPGSSSFTASALTCTSSQTFTATATGCPAPTITYSVEGSAITFPYAFPSGTTTVSVTASNGVTPDATCSFTVTVNPVPAPVVTEAPAATNACVNGSTSFTVATTGTVTFYQWQRKASGGAFEDILEVENATATTATLSLTNLDAGDDQSEYRVIVGNACASTTSDAALLTLKEITGSSISGTTSVTKGSTAPLVTFSATGGTTPYTFSYTINSAGLTTVSTLTGEATVSVSQSTASVGTFIYELVSLEDDLGCTFVPASSQSATITVEPSLPVALQNFRVSLEGPSAILKWETTSEFNSSRFEIERSKTGKSWELIGSIQSIGESNGSKVYTFTDYQPLIGQNLYRLKMVDRDGTYSYSIIRSITTNSTGNQLMVYPNPATDIINLKLADWGNVVDVKLYDLNGKPVYSSGKNPEKEIDVTNVPSGIYVLSVRKNDGSEETHKLIIVK